MSHTLVSTFRFALPLALVLTSSSCVTQARYDEAMQELQYFQRSFHDLDSEAARLQGLLAERDAQIELLSEGGLVPVEAGFGGDIDERMAELREIMARLGSQPNEVEVLEVEGGYGLRLQDAILFASGSAELLPDGRALVLRLADQIRAEPFRKLEVRGHTDSVPVVRPETLERFPHGNLDLSAARALEVAALLRGEGQVEAAKIVISGYGPSQPLEGNDTPEGRQRNRRVELIILD